MRKNNELQRVIFTSPIEELDVLKNAIAPCYDGLVLGNAMIVGPRSTNLLKHKELLMPVRVLQSKENNGGVDEPALVEALKENVTLRDEFSFHSKKPYFDVANYYAIPVSRFENTKVVKNLDKFPHKDYVLASQVIVDDERMEYECRDYYMTGSGVTHDKHFFDPNLRQIKDLAFYEDMVRKYYACQRVEKVSFVPSQEYHTYEEFVLKHGRVANFLNMYKGKGAFYGSDADKLEQVQEFKSFFKAAIDYEFTDESYRVQENNPEYKYLMNGCDEIVRHELGQILSPDNGTRGNGGME